MLLAENTNKLPYESLIEKHRKSVIEKRKNRRHTQIIDDQLREKLISMLSTSTTCNLNEFKQTI